jgi:hypothetical protein
MNHAKRLLGEILTSKKAIATLASVAVMAAKRNGWDIPADQLALLMGSLGAYVIGQGISDNGKKMSAADFATHVSAEVNKGWAEKSKKLRAEWEAEQKK